MINQRKSVKSRPEAYIGFGKQKLKWNTTLATSFRISQWIFIKNYYLFGLFIIIVVEGLKSNDIYCETFESGISNVSVVHSCAGNHGIPNSFCRPFSLVRHKNNSIDNPVLDQYFFAIVKIRWNVLSRRQKCWNIIIFIEYIKTMERERTMSYELGYRITESVVRI